MEAVLDVGGQPVNALFLMERSDGLCASGECAPSLRIDRHTRDANQDAAGTLLATDDRHSSKTTGRPPQGRYLDSLSV